VQSGYPQAWASTQRADVRRATEVMMMTLRMPISAGEMQITSSQFADRTVVTLVSQLDAETAPQLYRVFTELSQGGTTRVDVDLARLDFMDSSGLALLVAEHRRTKNDGGRLVILSPNRQVIRLFQRSGLMSYLVVEPRMSV
jgi:anti-sigma B factor antagonist